MYPLNRNRRLRSKQSLRNLIKESSIHPHDFIVPLFIIEGNNLKEEIPSMPNYFRYSFYLFNDIISRHSRCNISRIKY